jgi:hypothetical protein
MSSELLRPEHGHKEVNKQQETDEAHDKVLHRCLLQLLAEPEVERADREEGERDPDEDQVTHRSGSESVLRKRGGSYE